MTENRLPYFEEFLKKKEHFVKRVESVSSFMTGKDTFAYIIFLEERRANIVMEELANTSDGESIDSRIKENT